MIKIFCLRYPQKLGLGILDSSCNILQVFQLSGLNEVFDQFLRLVSGATQVVLIKIQSCKCKI